MFLRVNLNEKNHLLTRYIQIYEQDIPFIGMIDTCLNTLPELLKIIQENNIPLLLMIPFKMFVEWTNRKQWFYIIPRTIEQLNYIYQLKKEKEEDYIPLIKKSEKEKLLKMGNVILSFDFEGNEEEEKMLEYDGYSVILKGKFAFFYDMIRTKKQEEKWNEYFCSVNGEYQKYHSENQEFLNELKKYEFLEKKELKKRIENSNKEIIL